MEAAEAAGEDVDVLRLLDTHQPGDLADSIANTVENDATEGEVCGSLQDRTHPCRVQERQVREVHRDRSAASHGVHDRDVHDRHGGHVEFPVHEERTRTV